MSVEQFIARSLEGKFFLIDGRDINQIEREEREALARIEQEEREEAEIKRLTEIENARRVIAKQSTSRTLSAIVYAVAAAHKVRVDDILSTSRRKHHVIARQHFCWLARKMSEATLTRIGRFVGRDHATVKHSISKWEDMKHQHMGARVVVEELLA